MNLLIDIKNSIKAQQNAGYEYWANIFNLKQAAEALLFLEENNITDIDQLNEIANDATSTYDEVNKRILEINTRQKEINELQKSIGTYGKTRKIYEAYKKSGYNKKFLTENEKAIQSYQKASQHFSDLKLSKIPTIAELQSEYKTLAKEKDNIYINRSTLYNNAKEMQKIKSNIFNWLEIRDNENARQYKKIENDSKKQIQKPQKQKENVQELELENVQELDIEITQKRRRRKSTGR